MMRRTLLFLILFPSAVFAQAPLCFQKVQEVNADSLMYYVSILSGEDSTIINGNLARIRSRYQFHPDNELSLQYLYENCVRYNFQTQFQDYSNTGRNLIAWKPGHTYPNKAVMLVAHYDGVGTVSMDFPAADDNASGVATLLETARLFQDTSLPYTLLLGFFDEEEAGLLGSKIFVQSGMLNYELLGAINLDMIAYDKDNDSLFNIHTKAVAQSVAFADKVLEVKREYNIGLRDFTVLPGHNYTDQRSFWDYNRTAIAITEDYGNGFNLWWHQPGDTMGHFNIPYFRKMTQLALATICETGSTGVVAGKNEFQELPGIAVFPNPSGSSFSISIPDRPTTAEIELRDLQGKLLLQNTITGETSVISWPENTPEGIYLMKVITADGNFQQKLIKTNP